MRECYITTKAAKAGLDRRTVFSSSAVGGAPRVAGQAESLPASSPDAVKGMLCAAVRSTYDYYCILGITWQRKAGEWAS